MTEAPAVLPIGARVSWRQNNQTLRGEVVTYRLVGRHQVMSVKRSDGAIVGLLAAKARVLSEGAAIDAEPTLEILTPPLQRSEAEELARRIVAGDARSIRMPPTQLINTLATALVALHDGLLEGL